MHKEIYFSVNCTGRKQSARETSKQSGNATKLIKVTKS